MLSKTEQAWPRHVCASQSSEPVVLGVVEGWGLRNLWSTFRAHPVFTAIGPCNTACRGRQSLKRLAFLPGFYWDPQPEILTLPKFKDILLITNFSFTVWLEVRANT